MTDARQDNRSGEIRHLAAHRCLGLGTKRHNVGIAGNEKRGLLDLAALERTQKRPVAIAVAIPVQAPAEPAPGEFSGEIVNIFGGEPRGQVVARVLHEFEHERRSGWCIRSFKRRAAGPRPTRTNQHLAHRDGNIVLQLMLGNAGCLEIELIEEPIAEDLGRTRHRRRGTAFRGRHRQRGDGREHIRPHHRRRPGDRRPPVVPDDDRRLLPQSSDESNDVTNLVQERIAVDLGRSIGTAVAALIRRNYVIARGRQRGNLVTPRIPGLWKAVTKYDKRTATRLGNAHADAVRVHYPMRNPGHQSLPLIRILIFDSPCDSPSLEAQIKITLLSIRLFPAALKLGSRFLASC